MQNGGLKINKYFLLGYLIITVAGFKSLRAQDRNLLLEYDPGNEIRFNGFTLQNNKSIHIKAVVAGGDKEILRIKNYQIDPSNMFVYAWIIDASTRELVWRTTIGNTKGDWWNKWNRVFDDDVPFKKGKYEVYLSALREGYIMHEGGFITWGKLMDKIFGSDDWWEENSKEWKIEIQGLDEVIDQDAVRKYQHALKNAAVVDLTESGDRVNKKIGFTVLKPARLDIYAIGEGYEGEMYDYGYIINAKNRDRVWEMEYRKTSHAGGAIKNRSERQTINLETGDYVAFYKTDDNHSFDAWNANPPYDPNFYGMLISGSGSDFDHSSVSTYKDKEGTIVVRLDKLGDYENVSEGFTLLRPMRLRIVAIGEGRDGEMFDYGWIQNAKSGEIVWNMDYDQTEHAGGANKNRIFDGVVALDQGSYIANFITDDSHSYKHWNGAEPNDPEGWGIRIYTIGTSDDEKFVKPYNPEKEKNILVQITRVRDSEHIRKEFTLSKPTNLRIYALGEGDWDEMYDFGWIEDFNTGKIVWKMKYDETRRAGGDTKNRLFDGTIRLKAGKYIVHYQTDDSHAFGDWNADPPLDQTNWGITIYVFRDQD
jgi:hypothetical protein